MTKTTLLPCPFCAGEARMKHDSGNEVWNQSWGVRCSRCDARGEIFSGSNTWATGEKARREDKEAEKRAADWWNRRPKISADYVIELLIAAGHVTAEKVAQAREIAARAQPPAMTGRDDADQA